MSSLPQTSSSNFLSVPPLSVASPGNNDSSSSKRSHRHRRSAAISGDFDVIGSGLFASPPPSAPSRSEFIDNVYQFNNEEDFEPIKPPPPASTTSPVPGDNYSFPAIRTPDLSDNVSGSFSRNISFSPKRYQHPGMHYGSPSQYQMSSGSLNSPIRLSLINHRRAYSSNNSSRPKKLDEVPSLSDVPDPVIDLDEILTANLHIGGGVGGNTAASNSTSYHKRTGSAPAEFVFDDHEFLASPFLKQQAPAISSPFFSSAQSPLATATSSSVLINQPIHEKPNDDDDDDGDDSGNDDIDRAIAVDEDHNIDFLSLENQTSNNSSTTEFNPPNSLYITLSANSSSSSIRQNLIEKTLSNSSKESIGNSGSSNMNTIPTTTNGQNKRSGAKATRYQTFYDQSNRISNALKISSSESVNIVRSNSQNKDINNGTSKHLLGHASSFPSLKSNGKRSVGLIPPPPPLPSQYRSNNPKRTISPPNRNTFEYQSSISPSNSIKKINSNHNIVNTETTNVEQPQAPESHGPTQEISISKTNTSSTSPISIRSAVSSTVISSSGTLLSTDNSSLHSSHNVISKDVVDVNVSEKVEQMIPLIDRCSTPSIVVGSESSSSSTNSTYKQDDDSAIMQINNDSTINHSHNFNDDTILQDDNSTILKSPSSKGSPKRPSPRRPITSSEEKILRLTKIPTFNKSGPGAVSPPITSPTISSPARPTTKSTMSSSSTTSTSTTKPTCTSTDSKQSKRSSFYSRIKRSSMTLSLSDFGDLLPPPSGPPSSSSSTTASRSGSPHRQHHKSKSLSFSFQEFATPSSRPSSGAAITTSSESLTLDSGSPSVRTRERRKSNKFMSWFRKKSDHA